MTEQRIYTNTIIPYIQIKIHNALYNLIEEHPFLNNLNKKTTTTTQGMYKKRAYDSGTEGLNKQATANRREGNTAHPRKPPALTT